MQNPPDLLKHEDIYRTPNSALDCLARDVDSLISELCKEQELYAPPARTHSLQEPQRQLLILPNRSNTTSGVDDMKSNMARIIREQPPPRPSYRDYDQPPLLPLKNGYRQSTTFGKSSPMYTSMPLSIHIPITMDKSILTPSQQYSDLGVYNPYFASIIEPPMYPQHDINTHLNDYSSQPQEKVALASCKSSIRSSHNTCRDSDSSVTILNSQFSVNTQYPIITTVNTQYSTLTTTIVPTMDQSASSSAVFVLHAYGFMSVLSRAFIKEVQALENTCKPVCTNTYARSFTGKEAVKILRRLLDHVPKPYCILLASVLMKANPPLFHPIHYSQTSFTNSSDDYYTLQADLKEDDRIPTGLLTRLLNCYTYNCRPGEGGCYVPLCPNKPEVSASEFYVKKVPSPAVSKSQLLLSDRILLNDGASLTQPCIFWTERASKDLLDSLSKREIARQEAINEIIYSEKAYRNDLDVLSEVIVAPLLQKSIVESSEKTQEFVKEVFGNYKELITVSTNLLKDLLGLQHQYEQKCIPMIGDILIKHFAYFEDVFSRFCPRVALAEYLVKAEERNNTYFMDFIEEVEKNERMRRLPVSSFLKSPGARMQRYAILVKAALDNTDKDHPDAAYLPECLDLAKKAASRSNTLTEIFEQRVEILNINDLITFEQGKEHLQLTDPHRQLYYKGDIKRRGGGIENTDIHLLVFDHMVLMTKVRRSTASSNIEEYRVSKRPMPLQMLLIGDTTDVTNPTLTARTFLASTGLLLLNLRHLGRKGGNYTFLCSSDEKEKCVTSIEKAKAFTKERMGEDVYDVVSLDDISFKYCQTSTSEKRGKVNCTLPFTTGHYRGMLAIGTDTGVYFKSPSVNGVRQVLRCKNVSQVALLENYDILLVLSDKTLKAYPLNLLDASLANAEYLGQELDHNVDYFQVGICNKKDLVVFKKKDGVRSIFTASEPLYDFHDPKNKKYAKRSVWKRDHPWFKIYKKFYVGAESSGIHFLKTKFAIVCERGFEIIQPERLREAGKQIPDKADPQFDFVNLQADSIRPLAMYRVGDKFLLCYNRFAFYVNNRQNGHRVPQRSQRLNLLCEWEGTPESIVFKYPYIIAFDPEFIEIRHIDTGNLVQIVPGKQMRLTYFKTIGESTEIHGCMTHPHRPEVQNIFHLKLNSDNNSGGSLL